MTELSQTTKNLISQYQAWHQSRQQKENVSTLHVDEVASRVAAFYEKIREVVDWKEEHLMRRSAITRMLKRRLVLTKDASAIAEPLVLELIRSGRFSNDRIPDSKIEEVRKTIEKYIFILENSPKHPKEKQKLQFLNWIMGIAACEIEDILDSPLREKALMEYMTDLMKNQIKINQGVFVVGGMNEEEKNTQIYIAIQRALFKLDSPIISYHLLKRKYAQWQNLPSSQLQEITNNIYLIWNNLDKDLNHPLTDKFYKICERYDTPYLLLGDILTEENPLEVTGKISKPENLEELTKRAYHKRLLTLKKRLFRAAIYSTFSVFATNIFSFLFIEIPLAKMITGTFTPLTILVDIGGPTLLMFFLMITVRVPQKSNLDTVVMETMKIVYQREKADVYEIKVSRERGFLIKLLIGLFYLVGAGISFGAVVWVFRWAGFPPTSLIINVMFVALIAFAGLAIRNRAKELTVEEEKTGFFEFIFDALFMPVVELGRWLSNKWQKYNAITAFFNALIDMPFTIFVEFFEQWRFFLKEKKEEIH